MALAALLHRRTVRQYDPTYEIPKDVLHKIVDAALLSPTANNKQSIDLIVVTNKAVISSTSKAIYATWPAELKANFAKRTADLGVEDVVTCDAPCVIFLVKNERQVSKFVDIDSGIMVQSIIVAAQEFGLESMCVGVYLWGEPATVEDILKIPKGSLSMAVAIGKPKPNPFLLDKAVICKATYIE
jgi:nitroreductase